MFQFNMDLQGIHTLVRVSTYIARESDIRVDCTQVPFEQPMLRKFLVAYRAQHLKEITIVFITAPVPRYLVEDGVLWEMSVVCLYN
ncbi:hypothetical protein LSH36_19g07034 [Paralvinella palmiformis]|uniref:Uncharacterized protein n=1 Tax=Paralvinella palmiformis TaxID=53620 RepID=A0AAD9KBN8_9ANNE|nr:hypothetical protein LSH36_19g07034 [Paralvinella palmiformis]